MLIWSGDWVEAERLLEVVSAGRGMDQVAVEAHLASAWIAALRGQFARSDQELATFSSLVGVSSAPEDRAMLAFVSMATGYWHPSRSSLDCAARAIDSLGCTDLPIEIETAALIAMACADAARCCEQRVIDLDPIREMLRNAESFIDQMDIQQGFLLEIGAELSAIEGTPNPHAHLAAAQTWSETGQRLWSCIANWRAAEAFVAKGELEMATPPLADACEFASRVGFPDAARARGTSVAV
jgi:hypothetical protein